MFRLTRRRGLLPGLALLVGLTLSLAPARAMPSRHEPARPPALESLAGTLREWLAALWSGGVQKNGGVTDPDGRTSPSGGSTGTPQDGGANENGGMTDPNG
jgi:hypothetical protein